jgi:hypothetical protein
MALLIFLRKNNNKLVAGIEDVTLSKTQRQAKKDHAPWKFNMAVAKQKRNENDPDAIAKYKLNQRI